MNEENQQETTEAIVETTEQVEEVKSYTPAGFWKRFWASVADTIILNLPLGIILSLIFHGEWFHSGEATTQVMGPQEALNNILTTENVLSTVLLAVIVIAFWLKWSGMTPGKGLLKIRVVNDVDNGPLTTKQSAIRYASYFLSTLPLLAGFFMVAFRKDKKALHDLIAGTKVIYDPEVED
jgi:uncharacterized RDD family membrane protein YckC